MSEPRELFIITLADTLGPCTVVGTEGEADAIVDMIKRSNEPDVVHVIEHSAYTSAMAKLEIAKSALEYYADKAHYQEAMRSEQTYDVMAMVPLDFYKPAKAALDKLNDKEKT